MYEHEISNVNNALSQLRNALSEYRVNAGSPANFIYGEPAALISRSVVNETKVYVDRYHMLENMPKHGKVAELGTQYGGWAQWLLNVCSPTELHLFDIDFSLLDPTVSSRADVKLHHGDSSSMLSLFPDEYFDFIYIDGDHSHTGAFKDAQVAISKIKTDGIIAFNDYTRWSPLEASPYGVPTVVNNILNSGKWLLDSIALTPNGYFDVTIRKV